MNSNTWQSKHLLPNINYPKEEKFKTALLPPARQNKNKKLQTL